MPQKGAKSKPRPEISRPILLKSKSEDHSANFVISKPTSDIDLKKLREFYENKTIQIPVSLAAGRKENDQRRHVSSQLPQSEKEKTVGLCSQPQELQCNITRSAPNRATVYDEGDYVMLEFPFAEEGKVFRTDPISGKFEQMSKQKVTLKKSLSQNDKRTGQKSSPVGLKNASNTLPRTDHSESKFSPRIPSKPATDEDGYEAPLIFQTPVYMTLDFASERVPSESTPCGDAPSPAKLGNHSKGCSLEKQFYSAESALKFTQPPSETSSNFSKPETSNKPETAIKPSFLYSLSGESTVSNFDDENRKVGSTKDSVGTPINSFLASRLELASLKSDDDVKHRTVSAESWPSTALSSPFSDPGNDDRDHWSDSNDFSSDSDCYYHQIEPPDLSGHISDHDYAIIDDCPACTKPRLQRKKPKRSKSVKKAISLVVNGRSKSTENNKSPHTTPKLQRSNMQDMRTTDAGSSTWDTVSTPGILKLNNFKDLGKNR